MNKGLLIFVVILICIGCDSEDQKTCQVAEAYAGYPESFERPLENIEYIYRYDFFYENDVLVRVDEVNIEDERLLNSYTDFSIPEYEQVDNSQDGRTYFFEDDELKYFVTFDEGNAINQGIESKVNSSDVLLHSRNYYDDKPNIMQFPEYRRLPIGRGGIAAMSSKNNLIAWADLQGSGLVLDYTFQFGSSGRLKCTQIPSGLTVDFEYRCP